MGAEQEKVEGNQMSPTCPEDFFLFNNASFIILKVFEELSQVELFKSVLLDKKAPETEIFNYFAAVCKKKLTISFVTNVSFCLENELTRPKSSEQSSKKEFEMDKEMQIYQHILISVSMFCNKRYFLIYCYI